MDVTLQQLATQAAEYFMLARTWVTETLLSPWTAGQLGVIVANLGLAALAARPARALLARASGDGPGQIAALVSRLATPVLWLGLQWVALAIAGRLEWNGELLRVASTLLTAWIAIRIATEVVADRVWAGPIARVAWTIAALRVVHLLDPTIELMDSMALDIGGVRVSVYLVVKGMIVASVLLWLAGTTSRILQRRIDRVPTLAPSVRVLLSQLLRFTLISLAIILALGSVGIDLTAFALFSGAVGVGIGFGLQKVVSNIVSGLILLVDRSVKPGDVIEVGGTYGWVNSLGARYASVITRDGTEHLIPNEDLITQRVVNWSFSNNFVRRKAQIGIHYDADIDLATKLILEAARASERVLDEPAPTCLLMGFGDSSVDLELRFWIADPQHGTANVADDVLRRVWHAFHEHGVEIPYPQRDLHLRSAEVVRVQAVGPQDGPPRP